MVINGCFFKNVVNIILCIWKLRPYKIKQSGYVLSIFCGI